MKINGADVQSLSLNQVQRVLQDRTQQGEAVLLVCRGGHMTSPVITPNLYKPLPPPQGLTTPPSCQPSPSVEDQGGTPPALGTPQGAPPTPNGPPALIQSTSFLDSVPVTLTLEPRDLLGVEESAGGPPPVKEGGGARTLEVELRRRSGEGFGFVIASQEVGGAGPPLMSHRFTTVRGGSPAARSGLIRPGDQLEAVEGRGVGGLQHRDLSQILRRAGNRIRLRVTPRPANPDGRLLKVSRGKSTEGSGFYVVDLDRGPTGFGFSLRGGSEYNMGLYVLGLMEGGPAQRSNAIQVSDQLVEINSLSTAGMSHSQAVDQIRQGGNRIHLVLKKGNGYVPDYGPEKEVASSSSSSSFSFSSSHTEDAVTMTTTTLQPGGEKRRTRRGGGGGPPDLDLDVVEEEAREEERRRRSQREQGRSRSQREQGRSRSQREQGRSRSSPRIRAPSSLQEGEESGGGAKWRRSKTKRRDDAKHSGSSGAAFSFLMSAEEEPPSDSESAASVSELSQSAASIATGGWTEDSDWRSLWEQRRVGPWLKPSPQRLTKALIGGRLSGRGLGGGLSL